MQFILFPGPQLRTASSDRYCKDLIQYSRVSRGQGTVVRLLPKPRTEESEPEHQITMEPGTAYRYVNALKNWG